MMTPLHRVGGGGDQEKSTCLSPARALNIIGAPVGTKEDTTWLEFVKQSAYVCGNHPRIFLLSQMPCLCTFHDEIRLPS